MATTLTFYQSTGPTPTAFTDAGFFNDLNTMITANSGNSNFNWEVLSYQTATSPYYMVLGRKDSSAGRILLCDYITSPSQYNTAVFDQNSVSTGYLQIAWFPSGTASTPSNLTSSSGTIMGNDTGVVKFNTSENPIAGSIYQNTANTKLYYFDSYDYLSIFCGINSSTQYAMIAGKCLVDYSTPANAYDASAQFVSSASAGSQYMSWSSGSSPQYAGQSNTQYVRTNYGSSNRVYFNAWNVPTWAGTYPPGSTYDIMAQNSSNQLYYTSIPLIGQTPGEGVVLKLRQMAYGPTTNTPFQSWSSSTGVQAIQAQSNSSGSGSQVSMWFTNFQI